ncbi:MAG: DUF1579 domain-containing protein [Armatimonadetes bacterium]|nr:MAG: DUF1579 domain-containing protein [Armatimonadota bacterium]
MKRTVLTLLAAFAAFSAVAQEGMMDPTPPKEVANLQFMVGKWEATLKMFDPSGAVSESKATADNRMVMGGRFLQITQKMSFEGMEIEGMMLTTYDAETGKYVAWWYDQLGARPVESEGTYSDGKFVFVSKPYSMPGMGEATFRSTFERLPDGRFRFLLEMKAGGGDWTTMMDGAFKRVS